MSYLHRVVGVFATRRQELLDKAAAGDVEAAVQLDRAERQRSRRWRAKQGAAQGDERSIAPVEKDRAARSRYAAQKLKRAAGDPEAIANCEQWHAKRNSRSSKVGHIELDRAARKYGPRIVDEPPPYEEHEGVKYRLAETSRLAEQRQLRMEELKNDMPGTTAGDQEEGSRSRGMDLKLRRHGLEAKRAVLERKLGEVDRDMIEVDLQLELVQEGQD